MIRTENGQIACVLLKKGDKSTGFMSETSDLVALRVVIDNWNTLLVDSLPRQLHVLAGDTVYVTVESYTSQSKRRYRGASVGIAEDFFFVPESQVVAARNSVGEANAPSATGTTLVLLAADGQ